MRASRTSRVKDDGERRGVLARASSWIVSHPREFVGAVVAGGAGVAILVNALFLQPGPHPAPMFRAHPVPAAADATSATTTTPSLPRPRPEQRAEHAQDSVVPRTRTEVTADIQRELARRGFYDGTVDGIYGSKTDAAMRDFEQHSGLKLGAEPAEVVLRAILQAPPSRPKPKATPANHAADRPVPPAPIPVATNARRSDPLGELIAPSPKRVQAVQRALTDFGYGPLTPNGVFGPETERAIEKFERARKMPLTGHISDRLLRELAAVTGRPID